MKRLLVVLAMCSMFCIPLMAQEVPQVEVYGGYELIKDTGINLHGFVGAVEGNISQSLSIVGEFGVGMTSVTEQGIDVSLKDYTFLAGPRVSFRSEKARPFVHILFGGSRISGGSNVEGLSVGASSTNMAMAFGGGLDIAVTERISIRPVQLDLLYTRYSLMGLSGWDSMIRYSGGVVFKFGSK